MSEWPKETGCKPVGASLRWFKSISLHALELASGKEPCVAEVAHLVEHQPSKLRVAGSIPVFRLCIDVATRKVAHLVGYQPSKLWELASGKEAA